MSNTGQPTDTDPTVKKIQLTGEAAQSLSPSTYDAGESVGDTRPRARKSRKARKMDFSNMKIQKEGGGATSPGTMVQLAASHIPGSSGADKAAGTASPFTQSAATVGGVAPSVPLAPTSVPTEPAPSAGGGAPRVVLAKSKKKSKVLLTAAKPAKGVVLGGSKKRKTMKKVKVNVTGLTRKLHHAKKIHSKASKHTLDDIKKELVKAGLIKESSKAPEDILRQMYADFMVLKKKAL
jgi:hypothetical protein